MKSKTSILLLVLVLLVFKKTFSQEHLDTVAVARQMAYDKNFSGANNLLSIYNAHQPDVHSLHLHAHLLYWMKEFDKSIQTFDRIIRTYPENVSVRLDYGRILFQLGHFNQAKEQLEVFLQQNSLHAEAIT
ncbi:MAG TPA: tetratricopeptide repeat protein, partial [Flavisolibacter sp.]|nr:tetratricopeptide repeat protein [Flavisolibacter sp.]